MIASISIFFAIGAMLAWGVGDFLIQKGTRKIGDVETLTWIGILGSIGLLPFVWKDLFLVLESSNFLILTLLGIVTFAVGIVNFEALKRGKLSVVEVLLEFELPLTVLLGLFFFQERLHGIQYLLICVIFFGIILIAIKPGRSFSSRHFLEKGVVLAIVTAIGYGLINFLTAVGAKTISPILTIWFTWATFTLICLAYLISQNKLKNTFRHFRNYRTLIIAMGIIDTLAWLFFAFAVQKKELAITIAITESYPAISLLLGVAVNHEKISKLQMLGAAATICGSFLIGIL